MKINFTKMVASGNDFIVAELAGWRVGGLKNLAKAVCDRKYGIGADGLLVLEKSLSARQLSKIADIKMRIFNADGSEAQMCGNGARCAALSIVHRPSSIVHQSMIETKAGIIEAQVKGNNVKIKLTEPKDMKSDIPIKVNNRLLRVNFINTGVPHTVIFTEGLDKIDVVAIGRQVRYHKTFAPQGTNVDFVEVLSNDAIKIRTYERGVEDETLACGTGSAASVLLSAIRYPLSAKKINVHTKSGEILKVYFERNGDKFKNVWLEGKARVVFTGDFNY